MCELLVGLDHVDVLDVEVEGLEVTITIETRQILVGCPSCGVLARSKGRRSVRLADVNHGFRRVNVLWIKRRWCCPDAVTRIMDRGGPTDRSSALVDARPGCSLGHRAGRSLRQKRQRGR
jgi:hypothetical protein